MLKSGASDPEIYNSIEVFKEKFADYGRDRRSAIEFHLRNAERLLMPTTTTSIAMRALEGGARFSNSGTSSCTSPSTVQNEESGDENEEVDDIENENENEEMDEHQEAMDEVEEVLIDASLNQGQVEQSSTLMSTPAPMSKPTPISIPIPIPIPAPMGEATAVDVQAPSTSVMASLAPETNTSVTSPSSTVPPQITTQTDNDQMQLRTFPKNTEPKELFAYLVNFLQVTPGQSAALKDSRHVAKELDSALEKSLSMLGELRERLTDMGQNLDAEFSAIRSILTPTQTAKFLVWVAKNGACMHMLNELWSKVYPEPVSNDADDDNNDENDDDDNNNNDDDDDDNDNDDDDDDENDNDDDDDNAIDDADGE